MDTDREHPGAEPMAPRRRPAPSKEEFETVLVDLAGSVRATARHFGRDRRQIYRWLEAYDLRERQKSLRDHSVE